MRDKIPVRPSFRKITAEAFKTTYDDLARRYPGPGEVTQLIANTTAAHFLSGQWLDRYVHSKSRHAKYLCVDIDAPLPDKSRAMMRYWEFAENLLNLQHVPGFEAVLEELEHGKVESACAELDIARMIAFHDLGFRFIRPDRGPKLNYDFEIRYPDGFEICAEAAAKFESFTPNAKGINQAIKDSRKQLPNDGLGIILIKVPEAWIRDQEIAREIGRIALGYLKNSTHIMSIKFFSSVRIIRDLTSSQFYVYYEVSNPKFPNSNWDIFRVKPGYPRWWTRFVPMLRMPDAEPPNW
jgi:hypothetical protein